MANDFIEYKLEKKKNIFGTNFQAVMGFRILTKAMIIHLL